MFAFAELTNADPQYRGPEFDFDRIVKDLMNKVCKWRIEYDGWSLCFRDIIIYCCNKEVICLRENSLNNINTTASGNSAKIQHSRHIRHANKHQFHLCQSDAGECWSLIRDRISYFWFISPKMSCPHKHCRMWREGTPLRQRGRPRIFMPVTSVLVSSYLYLYHQDYITL